MSRPPPCTSDPRGRHPVRISKLYRTHYRSLVRLAALLVRDEATAEQVVQDAFVAVHRGRPRPRDADQALSQLRRSVVSRSRSACWHRPATDSCGPEPWPTGAAAGRSPTTPLQCSAVLAALHRLPASQREALILRYYADLSEADTAAAMGISRSKVKDDTGRGMRVLRIVLDECYRA
jgi:DNA-directed RNA polymerase specialized sigma24 family protein